MDAPDPSSTVYAMYEAWNDRDLDRCAALLHPACAIEDVSGGELADGRQAGRHWLARRARAHPHGIVEVMRMIAEGPWVAAETVLRGSAVGADERWCEVDEVREGLIVGLHIYRGRQPVNSEEGR
jgi:ketosteroid isomerase-like protein